MIKVDLSRTIALITGATRSGKSEWAEILAQRSQKPVIYIATAKSDPEDGEWQARLSKHKQRRPPTWQTLEVPYTLAETIRQAQPHNYLLVDALGTWLVNFLDYDDLSWERTTSEFLDAVKSCPSDMAIVSEEVGWGVVPAYESGSVFS